jgi:Ca-activated chloride channel family protein
MCFAWPEHVVYLLFLIPLAVLLGYRVTRQRQARELLADADLADRIMPGGDLRILFVRWLLLFLATALFLFAFCGPQLCRGSRPVERKGVDVLFMLDVSNSMLVADVSPDRLTRAKSGILRISKGLRDGRQALLLFAGSPLVQCPMTTDHAAFEALLGMVSTELVSDQGTAFDSALNLAMRLFERTEPPGDVKEVQGEKVIVLLSDGENHSGNFRAVADALKQSGVSVFTIVLGKPLPAAIPLGQSSGVKKDAAGKIVKTRSSPETMRRLAGDSGGTFFDASEDDAVYDRVAERISTLVSTSRLVMMPVERIPLYPYVLLAGCLLLLLELFLMQGRRR